MISVFMAEHILLLWFGIELLLLRTTCARDYIIQSKRFVQCVYNYVRRIMRLLLHVVSKNLWIL